MMNVRQGLPPRKLYRFSHSTAAGGWLFAWKTKEGAEVQHKAELRERLAFIVQRFSLIDATIKVYPSIVFLFFTAKPSINQHDVVAAVLESLGSLERWNAQYLLTGAYDLQEAYIRRDLAQMGFAYDKGE